MCVVFALRLHFDPCVSLLFLSIQCIFLPPNIQSSAARLSSLLAVKVSTLIFRFVCRQMYPRLRLIKTLQQLKKTRGENLRVPWFKGPLSGMDAWCAPLPKPPLCTSTIVHALASFSEHFTPLLLCVLRHNWLHSVFICRQGNVTSP